MEPIEEKNAGKKKTVKFLRSFTCPECGGQINLRTGAHALSAVCGNCTSVIDTSDERFQVIQSFTLKAKKTLIPLGARGVFSDITWEVIGYLEKKDKSGLYFWDEYLLFNPYHGFRFLVQMDGHWNIVTPVRKYISKSGYRPYIPFNDKRFKLFLRDSPTVASVQGEFYWQVKKGDRAKTEDYIAPPYMLSLEKADDETTASLCEYLEPNIVRDAFGLERMPVRKGIFANQPNGQDPYMLWAAAGMAIVVAVFIHVFTVLRSHTMVVLNETTSYDAAARTKTFTSQPIQINYAQNMLIETYAAVDNQWAEASFELNDEAAARSYKLRQGVEYYYGSSGGESWSEGSRQESDFISRIEPGTYTILYEVDSGAFPSSMRMMIKATTDKASWGNLWGTILMILSYPVFVLLRRSSFERKRWENSDIGGI